MSMCEEFMRHHKESMRPLREYTERLRRERRDRVFAQATCIRFNIEQALRQPATNPTEES